MSVGIPCRLLMVMWLLNLVLFSAASAKASLSDYDAVISATPPAA